MEHRMDCGASCGEESCGRSRGRNNVISKSYSAGLIDDDYCPPYTTRYNMY